MNRANRYVLIALALLGLLVIATQTVLRKYGLEHLRTYGDSGSYLATAETWIPDHAHMPTYAWLIRIVYELSFHVVPLEIIGVSLNVFFLLLTGLAFCTLVGHKRPWLALVLSLFPVRHFIFSTRVLADAGAGFFVVWGYVWLKKDKPLTAHLAFMMATAFHDFMAIFWVSCALLHLRVRHLHALASSALIPIPIILLTTYHFIAQTGEPRVIYEGRSIFTFPFGGLFHPPFKEPLLLAGFYASFVTYFATYLWAAWRCWTLRAIDALLVSFPPFVVLLCLEGFVLYFGFDRFLVVCFPVLMTALQDVNFKKPWPRVMIVGYGLATLMSAVYFIYRFPLSDR